MTENHYGRWKRRFPILRGLRLHVPDSQKLIVATGKAIDNNRKPNIQYIISAVLYNISIDLDEPEAPINPHVEGYLINEDDLQNGHPQNPDNIRPEVAKVRGKAERDKLLFEMPN